MHVRFGSQARREIRSIPPGPKAELRAALTRLEQEGLAATIDLRRLSTDLGAPVYRIRVGGWRLVFVLEGDVAQVVRVFPRREGYAWLERMRS